MKNCQIKSIWLYFRCPWQGLGSTCEERRGAVLCWTQFKPVPTDPLLGTADPSSLLGRASGKTYFRKGKKCQIEREKKGTKRMRKQQRETQWQRKMAERNHYVQTVDTPYPFPLHHRGGGSHKGRWSEAEPGKGGRKGGIVMCLFVSTT